MVHDPARHAIRLALEEEWEDALGINLQIVSVDPENVDALMRASRALYELGRISEACIYAAKILEIDPLHRLAKRCLEEWENEENEELVEAGNGGSKTKGKTYLFLEEPGKTKIVALTHLAEPKLLKRIKCGEEVFLLHGGYKLSVNSHDGEYIGRIADDLAVHIIRLMKSGNEYVAFVKSLKADEVKIFLRERVRSKTNASTLSFPIRR